MATARRVISELYRGWAWADTISGLALGAGMGYLLGKVDLFGLTLAETMLLLKTYFAMVLQAFLMLHFVNRTVAVAKTPRPNRQGVDWSKLSAAQMAMMLLRDHFLTLFFAVLSLGFAGSLVPAVLDVISKVGAN